MFPLSNPPLLADLEDLKVQRGTPDLDTCLSKLPSVFSDLRFKHHTPRGVSHLLTTSDKSENRQGLYSSVDDEFYYWS